MNVVVPMLLMKDEASNDELLMKLFENAGQSAFLILQSQSFDFTRPATIKLEYTPLDRKDPNL